MRFQFRTSNQHVRTFVYIIKMSEFFIAEISRCYPLVKAESFRICLRLPYHVRSYKPKEEWGFCLAISNMIAIQVFTTGRGSFKPVIKEYLYGLLR